MKGRTTSARRLLRRHRQFVLSIKQLLGSFVGEKAICNGCYPLTLDLAREDVERLVAIGKLVIPVSYFVFRNIIGMLLAGGFFAVVFRQSSNWKFQPLLATAANNRSEFAVARYSILAPLRAGGRTGKP
jgi:hypothetical protein